MIIGNFKLKTSFGLVFGLLLVFFCTFIGSKGVFAETAGDYVIQISPTYRELELKPGEVYEGSFKVQNSGMKDFKYNVAVKPYWINGEEYNPNYDTKNSHTKIAEWVKFSKSTGDLAFGQSEVIQYKIEVPLDVPAGGQYAVLMAQTVNDNNNNNMLNAVGRVGMVLYTKIVGGETRVEGKIIKNNIPGFVVKSPLNVTTTVENTGNVDFQTKVKTSIRDIFGKEVFNNQEVQNEWLILPDTTRAINVVWEKMPPLGIFKIKQEVQLADREVEIFEGMVFAVPLWLVLILTFIVVLTVVLIVLKCVDKKRK